MEGILRGIPYSCMYLNDILVTGRTEEEHLQRLDTVRHAAIRRSQDATQTKEIYLHAEIGGISLTQYHCRGTPPYKRKCLCSHGCTSPYIVFPNSGTFLGLVNYYGEILSNLASTLAPSTSC